MGMLLEGRLQFSWRGGNVHVVDGIGQSVAISLADFYVALADALELEQTIRAEQAGQLIQLTERGPTFIMET